MVACVSVSLQPCLMYYVAVVDVTTRLLSLAVKLQPISE